MLNGPQTRCDGPGSGPGLCVERDCNLVADACGSGAWGSSVGLVPDSSVVGFFVFCLVRLLMLGLADFRFVEWGDPVRWPWWRLCAAEP